MRSTLLGKAHNGVPLGICCHNLLWLHLSKRVGLWVNSGLLALKLLLQYLLFKGLPLFNSESAGVVLLSYFRVCVCYFDHWATRTLST